MKKSVLFILLLIAIKGNCQWQILSSGYTDVLLMDITRTSTGKLIAVGTEFGVNFTPHIFTSDDDGMTWDTTKVAPTGYFFKTIDFLNDVSGYIGGYGSISIIVETTDSGNTWAYTYVDLNNSGINDIEVTDSSHAVACGYGPNQFSSGSVYRFNNQASWLPVAQAFPNSSLDDIQMINPDSGYALSYSAKELYFTTDSGNTWTLINNFSENAGKMFWWDFDTGIVVGREAHYFITTDGGYTWLTDSISGYTDELTGVAFIDHSHGYACSIDGHLFYSSDGGLHWTAEPTITTMDLYALEIHGGTAYAVGEDGIILRHSNLAGMTTSIGKQALSVYPNPAKDLLTVELSGGFSAGKMKAELIMADGKIVASQSTLVPVQRMQFKTAGMEKGIYFIRITGDKEVFTQKVVIL